MTQDAFFRKTKTNKTILIFQVVHFPSLLHHSVHFLEGCHGTARASCEPVGEPFGAWCFGAAFAGVCDSSLAPGHAVVAGAVDGRGR